MADKTVSTLELTLEQRKKIAEELGLTSGMDRVPLTLTVVGVNSKDLLPGAAPVGTYFIVHPM